MTPATPVQLSQYRERHVIEPVTVIANEPWRPRAVKVICEHDGVRVFSKRGGGWRHDPSEVAALARIERGEA